MHNGSHRNIRDPVLVQILPSLMHYFLQVLDDVGSWWCLRAPSGRTGHVPKYNLDVIPNPLKESFDRHHEPPSDPIIVEVPVIVKTSVQREEPREESVKTITKCPSKRQPSPPKIPLTTPSEQPVDPPQSVATQPCSPEMEVCSSSTPTCQQQICQPSPQAIFPSPRPMPHSRHHQQQWKWPCYTVMKEIIREVSPSMRYHRSRSKRLNERPSFSPVSGGSGTSSSSEAASSSPGVASWVSAGGKYEKSIPRASRASGKKENKKSRQKIYPQPEHSHPGPIRCCRSGLRRSSVSGCRHRSVCCQASQPSTISTSDVSPRYTRKASPCIENQQQPQQPMIILLEAAKQELQPPQPTYDEQSDDNWLRYTTSNIDNDASWSTVHTADGYWQYLYTIINTNTIYERSDSRFL